MDTQRKLPWHRKAIRSLLRRCGGMFTEHTEFYLAAKPDFHTGFHRLQNFESLYADWIRHNGRIDRGDMVRFYFFYLQLEALEARAVAGAFAEVGVFRGTTARLLRVLAPERELFLFDTFEGFAEQDVRLEPGKGQPKSGGWEVSLDKVKAYVGERNTRFIPGRFPDTVSAIPAAMRFALVHLDTDLYAPQLAGLQFFYPRMDRGAVLIVHDCNNAWAGSRQALDEFFGDKPEHPVFMPDKSGSAVIIKS
jgi:O-methyltransferase